MESSNRRRPTQERGKERYEIIVQATKKLVGEKGNAEVSIRDIAKEGGIAPSTIYQYFDDKNDIIVAIMDEYFDLTFAALKDKTSAADTLDSWITAIEETLDLFCDMIREDPGWATIWSSIQASPALVDLDHQDALRNANLLASQFRHFYPQISEREALTSCVMLVQLAGLTTKMALFSDTDLSEDLIAEFKNIVRMKIRSMAA